MATYKFDNDMPQIILENNFFSVSLHYRQHIHRLLAIRSFHSILKFMHSIFRATKTSEIGKSSDISFY